MALYKECDACGDHGKMVDREADGLFGKNTVTGLPKSWTKNVLLNKEMTFCGKCSAEVREALTGALLRMGAALMILKKVKKKKIKEIKVYDEAADGET